MSGYKCYGVSRGWGVGIFGTRKECLEVVRGFSGARFGVVHLRADAEQWLAHEGAQEQAENVRKAHGVG